MELFDKLEILTDAAKYDAACGICHSFSSDGRCISLLKVLMSNACIYDCAYCVNKRSNDIRRASFTPRELAELTINFYKRNYIEGLFLSSAVVKNPDYTCERMIETLSILRNEYGFRGYIHAKAIPNADSLLIYKLGILADRLSVNIELPTQKSLEMLAPQKSKSSVLLPMGQINRQIMQNTADIVRFKSAPKFVPAGQSTQIIIGATPETDFQIIKLTSALYKKYSLKRVFYSAYIPINKSPVLPPLDTKVPLLREHRLYQADWLLRFYGFEADELLDSGHQSFNPLIDPKCNWAVNHPEFFPVEINTAPKEMLLRVPGIGVRSAYKIITARKNTRLDFEDLKKMGIVLKRAVYFITCNTKMLQGLKINEASALNALISDSSKDLLYNNMYEQLDMFSMERTRQAREITQKISLPL